MRFRNNFIIKIEQNFIQNIESVLREDKTVLSFVLNTLKSQVEYRKAQKNYLQKALGGEREANATGVWFTHEEVMGDLKEMLKNAKQEHVNKG